MEFFLYTTELLRMLTHLIFLLSSVLLLTAGIKTIINSNRLDKEKKKEIQRLKDFNDYYGQFIDKEND